ncbi:MAG: NCS2 family permease, partial [Novibacillus thermophilus]
MRTEVVAGVTTFLTMAYILIVNPAILAYDGGMYFGAVFVATAVA